jgi:hypothetical protein
MNNVHVLLDADNILLEVFINDIKPQIEYKYGKIYNIYLYCQSNLVFKYETMRKIDLSINCSKTRNKNSTDAQILFQAGVINGKFPDDQIIIVSNDQIYNEIISENIVLMGNNKNGKKLKLNKTNILTVFGIFSKDLKINRSKDIYIHDFLEYFSKYSLIDIENLIKQIPELCISKSNCVYMKRP